MWPTLLLVPMATRLLVLTTVEISKARHNIYTLILFPLSPLRCFAISGQVKCGPSAHSPPFRLDTSLVTRPGPIHPQDTFPPTHEIIGRNSSRTDPRLPAAASALERFCPHSCGLSMLLASFIPHRLLICAGCHLDSSTRAARGTSSVPSPK
jgi:hypothetical protein